MCTDCGCSDGSKVTMTSVKPGQGNEALHYIVGHSHDARHIYASSPPYSHPRDGGHGHEHSHDHIHEHDHEHHHDHHPGHGQNHGHSHGVVALQQDILKKNDALAARNRAWLAGREVLMLNLVSSPGSGKTSLLERTIRDLKEMLTISVIEGDQATANDGKRIAAAGAHAIQVNTGTGCHLEADMVEGALGALKPKVGSIVMIENVGNLVCPALFDLGENAKVAILSVTDGEDKPEKYPHMFRAARLLLLNKTDLLAHVDFDLDKAITSARKVNPDVEILQVSAKTGAGMEQWYDWIAARLAEVRL